MYYFKKSWPKKMQELKVYSLKLAEKAIVEKV